jgi:hypothetical protein
MRQIVDRAACGVTALMANRKLNAVGFVLLS